MNAVSVAGDVGMAVAAIEAQQAAAARVLREAAGMEVVGTFLLAGQEFALLAEHVR